MPDSYHPIDRARLTERARLAPPVHRYLPPEHLQSLVRHYWIPVWGLPEDTPVVEQVLQYPTCLIVIAQDYARFYGVARGLSTVTLQDRGWAVGLMLQPDASPTVAAAEVSALVDTHQDQTGFCAPGSPVPDRAGTDGARPRSTLPCTRRPCARWRSSWARRFP